MTTAHILTDTRDGVITITMNRPDKRNALTVAMYLELAKVIRAAVADRNVRVLVLQGAGGIFTSGNDLQDFIDTPPAGMDSPVIQFLVSLVECPKPIVVAVQGPAIGIGCTMLLHCDLVYADETAGFRMPFVSLGLCPEGASSFLLPRMAGHARAAELLMLGEVFDAATAKDIGLISGVRPAATLLQDVQDRARILASRSPASLRDTKELLRRWSVDMVKRALKEEGDVFMERVRSEEAMEALQAFFQKRTPDFSRFT